MSEHNNKVVDAKTNAKLAMAAHNKQNKQNEQAHTSEIASIMGMTKTITIAKGTDNEYQLTLQFPGVVRASEIEDNAANRFGNINFTELMREAIRDVIVSPHITSLDYWNTHVGFSEVTLAVLRFLNDGLNGEIN